MLSCEEALEQMSQALDGPLTGEEQGELEAHLACCPACRADWAALRELHQAMGELEETPAPEGARSGWGDFTCPDRVFVDWKRLYRIRA